MNRSTLSLLLAAGALAGVLVERDARACGGCFHPPTQTVSDITDERMLLSVSTQQTSLYDQLRYTGSPTSFAWVLPIHGTVDVALSADVVFDAVDALTTTTINPPESTCLAAPASCNLGGGNFGSAAPSAGTAGGVTVTKQENVGPYATVQLHSTSPGALDAWLAQNGYDVPNDVVPVINAYLAEGFDFLAMKLLPNEGIQAMRPVRVTMPGAYLSLPLRMAAVGTGPTVGITIWVVSDGRYEPQNFPFFHIDDSQLIWDWSTSSSNYTTLRATDEAALGGRGWEIESSIDLAITLIDSVIESGGVYYGNGGGGYVGAQQTDDAGADYLPVAGDDGGADGGSSPAMTADEVRDADLAALVAGMPGPNVRVTRIRSDISHAAMTADFTLQASSDQSELSNVRNVTQSINEQCPVYSNCQVVGTAPPAQAAVQTAANGNGGGTGGLLGCAAAPKPSDLGTTLGFSVAGLGMLGVVVGRIARRRRSRRSGD